MPLNIRQPTGKAAPPMILLDGPEKVGKSCTAYELSASPRVGDTFVFPVLERSADEYRDLGPYQIVETDGTWAGFTDQLVEATKMPMDPAKPNVIILDTGTALWAGLSKHVDQRSRNSAKNRKLLAEDPDADIDSAQNLWNDAKARWSHMLDLLAGWGGISVIVARGDEVTQYKDGQPVRNGPLVYRAQIEKSTPFRTTANVRIASYRDPRLVGLTKLGVELPPGGLELPRDGALDHLVFDIMGVSADTQAIIPLVGVQGGVGFPAGSTKVFLVQEFKIAGFDENDAKTHAAAVWDERYGRAKIDEVPESVVDEFRAAVAAKVATLKAAAETAAQAPADPPATDPAPAPQEGQDTPATTAPGESERSQPPASPEDAAEALAVANDAHPADVPASRFPGGKDPKAEAEEFLRSRGANPDAPSADPESTEGFDYDEDDDEDGEPTS